MKKNITTLTAEANSTFVAAQAILDQIAQDRQTLQVFYTSEVERLKLETEELERSAKAKDVKLAQAQQDAMTDKIKAEGLLTGLEKLAET